MEVCVELKLGGHRMSSQRKIPIDSLLIFQFLKLYQCHSFQYWIPKCSALTNFHLFWRLQIANLRFFKCLENREKGLLPVAQLSHWKIHSGVFSVSSLTRISFAEYFRSLFKIIQFWAFLKTFWWVSEDFRKFQNHKNFPKSLLLPLEINRIRILSASEK